MGGLIGLMLFLPPPPLPLQIPQNILGEKPTARSIFGKDFSGERMCHHHRRKDDLRKKERGRRCHKSCAFRSGQLPTTVSLTKIKTFFLEKRKMRKRLDMPRWACARNILLMRFFVSESSCNFRFCFQLF